MLYITHSHSTTLNESEHIVDPCIWCNAPLLTHWNCCLNATRSLLFPVRLYKLMCRSTFLLFMYDFSSAHAWHALFDGCNYDVFVCFDLCGHCGVFVAIKYSLIVLSGYDLQECGMQMWEMLWFLSGLWYVKFQFVCSGSMVFVASCRC